MLLILIIFAKKSRNYITKANKYIHRTGLPKIICAYCTWWC